MKKFFLKIINFIFPKTCALCGKYLSYKNKENICFDCLKTFKKNAGTVCKKCGLPLQDGGMYCHICKRDKRHFKFEVLRSVFIYEGNLRNLILKFKYSNRHFLAYDFAKEMAEYVSQNEEIRNFDLIIPVPISFTRKIKRGYNQAELIAKELSKIVHKPLISDVLYRKKITKPQFKLSKKERFENLKNSFMVKNPQKIKGKTILLIDDIATTGATMSLCARELKKHGGRSICISVSRD